jgi:hypothetical protein
LLFRVTTAILARDGGGLKPIDDTLIDDDEEQTNDNDKDDSLTATTKSATKGIS